MPLELIFNQHSCTLPQAILFRVLFEMCQGLGSINSIEIYFFFRATRESYLTREFLKYSKQHSETAWLASIDSDIRCIKELKQVMLAYITVYEQLRGEDLIS